MRPRIDPALASLFPTADSIPSKFRIDPKDHPAVMMVDGKVVPYTGATRTIESKIGVRQPDGTLKPIILGQEPMLTAEDAKRAVDSAQKAWNDGFGAWPSATPAERSKAVLAFADDLEKKADDVATMLMYEIDKPFDAAKKEVTRSVEYIRKSVEEYAAMSEPAKISGKDGAVTHFGREVREPLGVALVAGPFNYPINEVLGLAVPALLTGNTVLIKTPRFGQLANQMLMDAFAKDFPAGAVNVLPGNGKEVLPAIMGASDVDEKGQLRGAKVQSFAFVGSEGAANAILKMHPDPLALKSGTWLGAKNPGIVLPDADIDSTVSAMLKGALGFNGERCTAEKIIYVPREKAKEFADKMAKAVSELKLGMPWDNGAQITPLAEDGKVKAMHELLDDAAMHGGKVINAQGGTAFESIMRPAVVYPVTPDMRLFHEEQFGPIVPIVPYDDIKQVMEWEKSSRFGQQASVWGSKEAAKQIAPQMARLVGRVNLNGISERSPDSFGFGATDQSGSGTRSYRDAIEFFTRKAIIQGTDEAAVDAMVS
jgi:glyceraldehyde-3-phosphate dehydrogenase (NADP+)